MNPAPLDLVLLIETLALYAWPAEQVEALDGWLLRRHENPSRRVNSVWPNAASGSLDISEKISRVETCYAGWDRPARYQVCPAAQPADLDQVLAGRGYAAEASTDVQTAPAASVLATARPAAAALTVWDRPEIAWAAAACAVQGAPETEAPVRLAELHRIERPCVFFMAELAGRPAAVGRGVLDGDWLGIFGMATAPAARRRGLATALVQALARWAAERGAGKLYLQVMQDNAAARELYSRLGFKTRYSYHYRTAGTADFSLTA